MKFPKLLALCKEKNIKLYLDGCKVVRTLAGKWCLVSIYYGDGYYGTFADDGTFKQYPSCKFSFLEQLQRIEDEGLAAVAAIGLATGHCCVCGRTLTAEDSIAGGIGPICADKIGFTHSVEL